MDLAQRLIWAGWGLAHVATFGLVGWGSMGAEVAWTALIAPGLNTLAVIDTTSSQRSGESRKVTRLISVVLVGIVGLAICVGLLFLGAILQAGLGASEPSPQEQSTGRLLWWGALANLAAMFTTFLVVGSSPSEGRRDRLER